MPWHRRPPRSPIRASGERRRHHGGIDRRALCASLAATAFGALLAPRLEAQRPARVAAAADLNVALPEIAASFRRATGHAVDLVFGSSGTLTRQMRDGAPFDLFLSADEEFVAQLAAAGLTRDAGVLYGLGRIVLFAPTGSPLSVEAGLEGLARQVAAGAIRRFAIANPAHAPYGRAAEAALRRHGVWDGLQPRLVLGENVAQAAQFATTGNAAGGIIAYSLALAPNLRRLGTFALIPASDHPPLRQRMVRLAAASPVAERFYQFLQEPAARATFAQYGFAWPQ